MLAMDDCCGCCVIMGRMPIPPIIGPPIGAIPIGAIPGTVAMGAMPIAPIPIGATGIPIPGTMAMGAAPYAGMPIMGRGAVCMPIAGSCPIMPGMPTAGRAAVVLYMARISGACVAAAVVGAVVGAVDEAKAAKAGTLVVLAANAGVSWATAAGAAALLMSPNAAHSSAAAVPAEPVLPWRLRLPMSGRAPDPAAFIDA